MMEQSVVGDWWEQLGMDERVGLLHFSDMAELKVAAGVVARATYGSLRSEIREVIDLAFLEGRDANGFFFGISWAFDCPLCGQHSIEKGSIRFPSNDPQELSSYLAKQGAACMNCHEIPPRGVGVQVEVVKAPLVVLRELGFAAVEADCPSTGTHYFDAWVEARRRAAEV